MQENANDLGNFKEPAHNIIAEYTIEESDTLPDIAQKYGVSIDEIIAANPGINEQSDMIQPGLKIFIPHNRASY
ncbi:MAG TPA: LysM domain-containing protein [Flavisolibacter sp.]|nr:LysM domain-containing protein [Flavisolibacter sp.]